MQNVFNLLAKVSDNYTAEVREDIDALYKRMPHGTNRKIWRRLNEQGISVSEPTVIKIIKGEIFRSDIPAVNELVKIALEDIAYKKALSELVKDALAKMEVE